ncbi:MAG: acyl-CoA thioesterase II, partial [Myxococcota bacterium]
GDKLPEAYRKRATVERPIEARVVRPRNPFQPEVTEPVKQVWYRAVDPLADDDQLHTHLLTYASDFHFLTTALNPHGVSYLVNPIQIASLDHAMWFHRPFRMDEWLLHVIESPSASGARGLVTGRFYDQAGRLVASTAQEGLIRQR